jgi:peptidoglycan/LPS O-acetylase OafA/YrhL
LLRVAPVPHLDGVLDARVDALCIGCIVALVRVHRPGIAARLPAPVAALCLAGIVAIGFAPRSIVKPVLETGGFVVVALLSALLILVVVQAGDSPVTRVLAFAPFVAIGRISYGLYLWHVPIFRWFAIHGDGLPAPVAFGGKFVATFAVAGVSWYVVERPALRLKSRFSARREEEGQDWPAGVARPAEPADEAPNVRQ